LERSAIRQWIQLHPRRRTSVDRCRTRLLARQDARFCPAAGLIVAVSRIGRGVPLATLIHCYGHAMRVRDWAVVVVLIVITAVSLFLLFTGAVVYTDTP